VLCAISKPTKDEFTKNVTKLPMKYLNVFFEIVDKYNVFPEKQKEKLNESYRSDASLKSLKAKKPSME